MDTYTVRRTGLAKDGAELERIAAKSTAEGEKMSEEVRWIRSYVVEEADGTLGTLCIYQATGPDAIERHASNTGMPAEDIMKVVDTVVVREDPVPA